MEDELPIVEEESQKSSLPLWPAGPDNDQRIDWLIKNRGLKTPAGKGFIFIAPNVPPENFGRDMTIYKAQLFDDVSIGHGSILYDAVLKGQSVLGDGCELGAGGSVTVDQSFLGNRVHGSQGSIKDAVILDDAQFGFGTSIRQGCLIDAEASLGQSNDLKNTYMGVATLLGSSTNFCDIAFCGGRPSPTVAQSEIGSGTIHFNFGIHGKKWGSWIGSIESLFLDRERCFMGGRTSLIGPVIVPDGIVTIVGSQIRNPFNVSLENYQQALVSRPAMNEDFDKELNLDIYGQHLASKYLLTREIIARYRALSSWFRVVRSFIGDREEQILAARRILSHVVAERLKWINEIARELPKSIEQLRAVKKPFNAHAQTKIRKLWKDPELTKALGTMDPLSKDTIFLEKTFIEALHTSLDSTTLKGSVSERIKLIPEEVKVQGRAWLASIIKESTDLKVT
ncbi:MAG: hypothetical protein P1V97_30435 [Planctomycetota bacterium]|nr:hypothetical protein [Planctomycetota bacterium]